MAQRRDAARQREESEAKDAFHKSPLILPKAGRGASKCLGNRGTALTPHAEGAIPHNPPDVKKSENIPLDGNRSHGRILANEHCC